MQLVVVLVRLEVVDRVLPVGGQDILILAVQTLMYIGPGSGVEFGGCEARIRKLYRSH